MVSVLEVRGNLVSRLQEVLHQRVAAGVVGQVLLGDVERLELLDGVVVVSNLRERERLLVDLTGVDLDALILEARVEQLLVLGEGGLVVLLVKRDRELVELLVHGADDGLLGGLLLLLSLLLGKDLSMLLLLGFLFLLLESSLLVSLGLGFGRVLFLSLSLLGLLGGLGSSLCIGLSFFSGGLLGCLGSFLLGKFRLVRVLHDLVFGSLGLLELKSAFGLHLLLDLEHLQLCFGLATRQLVLSLESGQVGLGCGLLCGSCLRLLDSLSGKELLLHLLSLASLSSFLLLELLELLGTLLAEDLLSLAFLLGKSDLGLKLLGVADLSLTLLLLVLELLDEQGLLLILLLLELDKSLAGRGRLSQGGLSGSGLAHQSKSLLVRLLSSLLEGLLHGGKLLDLGGSLRFLSGLDLDDERLL